MRRTNELVAHTTTQWQQRCLCEWFVANCALYDDYAPFTGTATAQQVKRKNDDAWRSFFATLDEYHARERDPKPSPPGYWGNRQDGYDLRGLVRNDLYEIEGGTGKQSTLAYDETASTRSSTPLPKRPRWTSYPRQIESAFTIPGRGWNSSPVEATTRRNERCPSTD